MEAARDIEPLSPTEEASQAVDPQQSIMDQLVAVRQEAVENQTVDIDLPGYKGLLVARYGLCESRDLAKVGKRVRRQFHKQEEQILAMSCDVLAMACEGFYFRDENGDLVPIKNGSEILDYRTAGEFLQFEATSARDSVMKVFAGNEIAVLNHQVKLSRWMGNTGADIDNELLGE